MDVLNSLALPQSTEHFHLLLLVYNIVMAFLFPYLALLVGSIVTAVVLDRRAESSGTPASGHLARRLAGLGLPDRSTFMFLAAVPALVVALLFAQMFQDTTSPAAGFAICGALLLIAGGVAGFAFKYTFTVDDMIVLAGKSSPAAASAAPSSAELSAFLSGTRLSHRRSGLWAAILLLCGSFLFVGAPAIGLNPFLWDTVDGLLAFVCTGSVWIEMLAFLALAAAMCGAGVLFSRYVWHAEAAGAGEDDSLLRTTAIRLCTSGILGVPPVALLSTAFIPEGSLSGWVYLLLALTVIALGFALHFLYAFVTNNRGLYVALLLASIVVSSVFSVTRSQMALHIATADHAARLAGVYDRKSEQLRASLGVTAKQLTGEDIYNAKCSACHLFDQKKVGPPYKEVIVKYAKNKPGLIAFVMNPVKVNPAYPNMPAQGLRLSEADSIATYLLGKVVGTPR